MTYGGNILNKVSLLVARFFVLRSFPGNNPIFCFSGFGFRPGVLSFLQLIVGINFYPVKFVFFFCRDIMCVCCDMAGVCVRMSVGVEIVTVYFCTIVLAHITGWQ